MVASHTSEPPRPTAMTARYRRLARFGPDAERRRLSRGYSRFVRLMKLVLPMAALGLIGALVLWPRIEGNFLVDIPTPTTAVGGDIEMLNPRFFSRDDAGRPYALEADAARESVGQPGAIDLSNPIGEITLDDGLRLSLTGDRGEYLESAGSLVITGGVGLYRSDGTEFRTSKAQVDLASGRAWGDEPVSGSGPFGSLQAAGFRYEAETQALVLTGQSKLVLNQTEEVTP